MKTSNSKLTAVEKGELKALKEISGLSFVTNGKTTIAYKVILDTVHFSTSVASYAEKKLRNKVGQYHALMRFRTGEKVVLDYDDFLGFLDSLSIDYDNAW